MRNNFMNKKIEIFMIIIGLLMFIIPEICKKNIVNEYIDYIETKATYITKEEGSNSRLYNLVYEYKVDGKTYYYITNYETSEIPKKGDKKVIKYNPNNPIDTYDNDDYDAINSFLCFFQGLGIFLIFMISFISYSDTAWCINLIISIFSFIIALFFILNNLKLKFITFDLIIIGIISTTIFIKKLLSRKIHPLIDIKTNIELRKKEKERKKKSIEFKEAKKRKKIKMKKIIKLIIISLLLFIFFIIFLLMYYNNILSNKIFKTILPLSAGICFIALIITIMYIIFTLSKNDNIPKKKEENTESKKVTKRTIWMHVVEKLLLFLAFILMSLVAIDPLNLFNNNGNLQFIVIIIIVIVTNFIYFYKHYC